MQIESTTLDINGHTIHVEMSGSGKPLMLINGLGGDPNNFGRLRASLDGFRTIIYDPPGVGRSSDVSCPIRIPCHARIAGEVLKQLGIESASVLGVSWGGAVAQELARQEADLVSKLVLVSTTPGPMLLVSPRVLLERSVKLAVGTKAEWMQTLGILGWTSLCYLPTIQQSTLVVSGSSDSLVLPYNARLLHTMLPNSELRLIENEGHWLIVNRAETLARMIKDFI